ncbi:hypothetical protein [Pelagibius sp.]|uniref:hypothetical protein n=1 Tax=Pelagibius sp. TaxID=1931238 RepID=UPI0026054EFE|nr:hypothetical protein [Pelagibius sp.]
MNTCDDLEKPPGSIGPAIFKDPESDRRIILATPCGDERLYRGRVHHTFPLDQAVERLVGGTTLRLLPGKYYRAVDVKAKRGGESDPIVIEGSLGPDGSLQSQICGTNAAGAIYPDLPTRNDYAFFKVRGCRHLILRQMHVESCWPSFVYAEHSSSLTVEGVVGQDGTYLVFVRGPDSRDIAVRGCRWVQDPTGTMWSAIDWSHTHHGPYAYYNGALVGGIDLESGLEVVGNVVEHAYNGVRFTTSAKSKNEILGRFNVNVRIHGNEFSNIRDNVIEPERTLINWHISDNRMKNTHAPFSIHDFVGGYLYIYGNRIWFDDRGGADYQGHRGGKIFKLRPKGPMPDHPIHIFHNSVYSRTFLIKKARSRNFVHRNNAVQFCEPSAHDLPCLCRGCREFLNKFPVDGDEHPLPWDKSVVFDGDASNRSFGKTLADAGQEENGIKRDQLGFVDPLSGDFALLAQSPLRDAGLVFTLESKRDLPEDQLSWSNWARPGRPHIGAVQKEDGAITLPFVPVS